MKRRLSNTAFTLVELLVCAALLVFLLTMVLKIINHSLNITSRAGSSLEIRRIGRDVTEAIRRDLSLAMLGRRHTLNLQINPPPHNAPYANADALFWQIPMGEASSWGGIATVGYFVQHDLSRASGGPRFQLRRLYAAPEEPGSEVTYLIYSQPDDWTPATVRAQFAPATTADDLANAQRGWVADGVLGLWVRALDANGQVIDHGNSSGYRYDSRPAGISQDTLPSRLPAAVEVLFVCMAPRELPRLQSLPGIPPVPPPADGVDPLAQLHTTVRQWTDAIRTQNPGVETVTLIRRRVRLYQGE